MENLFTAEGKLLHEAVDKQGSKNRGGLHIARSLPVRSLGLGLSGIADVVEFHRSAASGVSVPGLKGKWTPFPVEFKRGEPKRDNCDKVQLCAQAICLEEHYNVSIAEGALFYGRSRRRQPVFFDQILRRETHHLACRLHEILNQKKIPTAIYSKRCLDCSLLDYCQPKTIGASLSTFSYWEKILEEKF